MPTPGMDSARQIVKAVQENRIPEEAVDACVDRLLDAVLTLTGRQEEKPSESPQGDWSRFQEIMGNKEK